VEILRQMSIAAHLALLISAAPLAMGLAFLLWPSERRLALMRPLSTAGAFAGICNILLGLANSLIGASGAPAGDNPVFQRMAAGLAEALVAGFLSFACLTAAWLFVAVGMRKLP
jgi:hypothetical protein